MIYFKAIESCGKKGVAIDMTLKYYLRGLGIGIIVTAVIMGISMSGRKATMTDAEVKERAKELGMVESTVLAESAIVQKERESKEETVEAKSEQHQEEVTEPESEQQPDDEALQKQEPSEETAEADSNKVIKNITIFKGDSSESVSTRLAEAGLVESAKAYNLYLCNNHYDKSLSVGTYEIPSDATDEEIAQIITGRK